MPRCDWLFVKHACSLLTGDAAERLCGRDAGRERPLVLELLHQLRYLLLELLRLRQQTRLELLLQGKNDVNFPQVQPRTRMNSCQALKVCCFFCQMAESSVL